MTAPLMFALLGLGGWEMVLFLAIILLLFGARRLPDLTRGFGKGISEFQKSLDEQAHDAGRSVGGIHGKPAAQALTPDNKTAELYDPAAFQEHNGSARSPWWRRVWQCLIRLLKAT